MLGILALALVPSLFAMEVPSPGSNPGLSCGSGWNATLSASAEPEGSASAGREGSSCAAQEKVKIDADKIYYGSPNAWTRAGVIDGSAVLKATASWKEMEKRSIKRGDPEYDLYKIRAEKEARVAIDRIAKNQRPPYDLIGEIGSIVIKGGVVPNLTDEILQELGS